MRAADTPSPPFASLPLTSILAFIWIYRESGDPQAIVELSRGIALIGFCGAPWTVASYLIEGGSSDGRALARLTAYHRPAWFRDLIERLVEASSEYLARQVEARHACPAALRGGRVLGGKT